MAWKTFGTSLTLIQNSFGLAAALESKLTSRTMLATKAYSCDRLCYGVTCPEDFISPAVNNIDEILIHLACVALDPTSGARGGIG